MLIALVRIRGMRMRKRLGKIVLLLAFKQPGRRDAFNTLNSASSQVLMAKEEGETKVGEKLSIDRG